MIRGSRCVSSGIITQSGKHQKPPGFYFPLMFHPTTANPHLITNNPQHCKDGHGWEWKAFASLCWRANLRGAECHHQEQIESVTLAAGIVGAGWALEPLHGLCAGPLAVLLHPEEWGEAWEEAGVLALHCTDLSIKCSRVRDVLACNQWRAMLAWNRGSWTGSTEERTDTWKTVRKEKLVKE